MKIIDWERKGNVIRFHLGEDDLKNWYGDDWNDKPYEHNAGKVYEEFIKSFEDLAIPFDLTVLEPSDLAANSDYSKDDFRNKKIPFLIIHKLNNFDWESWLSFIENGKVIKVYFGDKVEDIKNKLVIEEL